MFAAIELLYFYPMQKTLQQLDLFGFPIETAPAGPKKREKPVTAARIVPESQVLVAAEPEPVMVAEPVVVLEKTVIQEPVALSVARKSVAEKVVSEKIVGKRGRKSFKEMDSEADLIEIPADEILQQKLYYSISEVAGWFKVNTSLLRYWENEFDILQPRKTRKGDRLFRVEDIKNLQLIYFLLRQRKFSIDGAKNYLKNNKREADKQVQLSDSLTKFRSFLLEMKANLQA